jgi:hypothetical protein
VFGPNISREIFEQRVHTCCYKHGPKSLTTISRTSFAIGTRSFTLVPLDPDFLMLSENASKHEAADDTALTIEHMLLLSHSSEHMPAIPKERSRERGRDSCKRSDRSYRGRRH